MSLINVTSTTIPLAIKVFANSLRSPLVSIRTASSLEETTEKMRIPQRSFNSSDIIWFVILLARRSLKPPLLQKSNFQTVQILSFETRINSNG